MRVYNKPKVMGAYRNLNHLALSDESVASAVNKWRGLRDIKDNSIDDLARSDNMIKCMLPLIS